MSGSPSTEKQQRILFANRIGFVDFSEQILSVSELRFELLAHFGSNLVAAGVDSRADHRFNVFGQCAEPTVHFSHSFFHNAFDRPAPTRVKHSDGLLPGIYQDDRKAIGGLDGKENAGCARDEAIANQWLFRKFGHAMNKIGVNLAEGDEWPRLLTADGTELR